jgi:N,N'-diacetyllegionaminate synthase
MGSPERFHFLECVAQYPAKPEAYNLGAIIHPNFGGISDHTTGEAIACAAAALGAVFFEKHFNALPGNGSPDAPVSIGPGAMKSYCRAIREVAGAVQPRVKVARAEEREMTTRWRRRLKVIAPVKKGELMRFNENFGIYRSMVDDCEAGPPMMWQRFQGKPAKADLAPGDPVWTSTVEAP